MKNEFLITQEVQEDQVIYYANQLKKGKLTESNRNVFTIIMTKQLITNQLTNSNIV